MPRRPRAAVGGLVYHVLNRANARRAIFLHPGDYAAFERVLAEALARVGSIELFTYGGRRGQESIPSPRVTGHDKLRGCPSPARGRWWTGVSRA